MQETNSKRTLADSITAVPVEGRGQVVVCGSHGGLYSAGCALGLGVPAVLFSDAGLGLEGAGIAGLALLQSHGVPAAAVSHDSARIGDAGDIWERGRVRALNEAARACGVGEGMSVRQACALLPAGRRPSVNTAALAEARHAVTDWEGVPIWLLDSNSLVGPGDVGAIVVTGSHGGLLGGRPETAIKQPVFAAFYNDAGVGIDGAGLSRLPVLDQRGIAGIAIGAMTARVGDGRSSYEDGAVSFVNERAAALGVRPGMHVREAVATLALAWIFSNPTRTFP
jgi:uncharacterized protein YunC (DUF1805 family)